MLGSVIGAAIFGTLLGPILGTLAVTVGTGPVFAVVGVVVARPGRVDPASCRSRRPDPRATETSTPLRDMLRELGGSCSARG